MLEPVMIVNVILACMAVIAGLCSRSFLTALVAGVVLGLIHVGLVVLIGLQSGSLALSELPYLKDGVDMAMQTGHLNFANARYATYLAESGLALLLIVIAGWIVRSLFVLMGLAPKRPELVEAEA
ncbi:hypothetical protein [Pseudorhodoplanes sp.]|uniref:hypothetical protein n=1 Tax=Pseudorhodoplanes sp. TaxID=1934341 RepID=UPI002C0D38CD|nr:hypothetical protein [Pseudorhodoplanes sp.]HWV54992.1 hypothetical protein [Pseudorhodoplanes sp.]